MGADIRFAGAIRRWISTLFLLSFASLICMPGITQWLGQVKTPPLFGENRALAAAPRVPANLFEALTYPARLEPFLQDHFGFRAELITLNNWARYHLFDEFISRQIIAGRDGRIFLSSHNADYPYSLIRRVCGIGISDAAATAAAQAVSEVIHRLRRVAPSVVVVIAPSASSLYPDELPSWLARQCSHGAPAVPRVAQRISAEDAGAFAFPIAIALETGRSEPVIPYASFHWWGPGVRRMIDSVAERNLGRTRRFDIPMVVTRKMSDLTQFMPGLTFEETVRSPDWSAVHVDACIGEACFPEIRPVASLLGDVSRYRGPPGGQGRLLVLSDSFGAAGAGYFSAYFNEVEHFSINGLARLSPAQIVDFRDYVFESYRPDAIVVLFHDGAILSLKQNLLDPLWPQQATGGGKAP